MYLTNVANTRTFNLVMEGVQLKLVGADVSKFERESFVENVVLAPAQRYLVDAQFDKPGTYVLRAVAGDSALTSSENVTVTVMP